jgi:hypothetical protein
MYFVSTHKNQIFIYIYLGLSLVTDNTIIIKVVYYIYSISVLYYILSFRLIIKLFYIHLKLSNHYIVYYIRDKVYDLSLYTRKKIPDQF